jgi:hypothetical protein
MSLARSVLVRLPAGRAHDLGVAFRHLFQEVAKSFTAVSAQNVESFLVHVATHSLGSIPLKFPFQE